jgi:hypothetical protein
MAKRDADLEREIQVQVPLCRLRNWPVIFANALTENDSDHMAEKSAMRTRVRLARRQVL